MKEEVAMCSGDRLVADFAAGAGTRPGLPEELDEHLTATANGLWVVWREGRDETTLGCGVCR